MATILILGGYGATGKFLVKHLLAQTEADIILAGRNLEKARLFAGELNTPRVSARQADAADPASFRAALKGVDLCLMAAPTTHQAEGVIRACLDARVDYLDVQFSNSKLALLQRAEEEIKQTGLCFVTEAGFHPGLPAAMVRYAATRLDTMQSAITAGYLNMGHDLPYSDAVDELMEAFMDYDSRVFKDGKWTPPKKWEMKQFDFGSGIGNRACYSMFFEETRCLPQIYPSLRDMGFYISGSNWIADMIVTPIVMLGLKIAPKRLIKPMGKLMWWGMKQAPPPYVVMIAVEAAGIKDGRKTSTFASVSHPDGYELTAIPVVAYLKQYLDGSGRLPGLHMMGQIAEPLRLFADMEMMGAEVRMERG